MRWLFSIWLALVGFNAISPGAESQPNFSGIWKLLNQEHPPRIMIIDHSETGMRVYHFVGDHLVIGKASIDIERQSPDVLVRWEGETHLLRLSTDGRTMWVKHGASREKWQRQDTTPRETFLTGFDRRLKLGRLTTTPLGMDGNLLRGWIAHAFNDVPGAERELLPLINQQPRCKQRGEARAILAQLYLRNGMVRKALPYCNFFDHHLYKKVANYPEMTVSHHGYGRVQTTRDSEGRIMLPVSAAGKYGSYMVDTGSNNSLLKMSEAARLGLKLESPRLIIMNGVARFDSHLAIVPDLLVGAIRLENVPFWVVPDSRLDWPGVIGIDVLLKLETLRVNKDGAAEIGFPPGEKDIRRANLCFWHNDVLADVSSKGQGNMIFLLDTGSNTTDLYPRFMARFPDLVSPESKQTTTQWTGLGAHREFLQLTVPEITLSMGAFEATLHQTSVQIEKQPGKYERHGVIGMDVLNAAHSLTLDLHAMRLTLE